jgi:lipoprotein-anchoring transpeptidase ErfK/SrfK
MFHFENKQMVDESKPHHCGIDALTPKSDSRIRSIHLNNAEWGTYLKPSAPADACLLGATMMTFRRQIRRAAIAASAVLLSVTALTHGASAQSWDWGGSQSVGGSGRTTIRFNPTYKPGQLIVSFADRRLYHVTRPGEANSYPIATPREQSRWQGAMTVTQKRVNPSWTPTPTMRAENPRLPMWVPGGHPMNPLGNRALYLGSSAYRIHGTDAPWTIGTPVSKGCIRMYNQDVAELYERVPVGANVIVTWQRFDGGAPLAASETVQQPAARPIRTTFKPKKYVSAE